MCEIERERGRGGKHELLAELIQSVYNSDIKLIISSKAASVCLIRICYFIISLCLSDSFHEFLRNIKSVLSYKTADESILPAVCTSSK